MNRRSWCIAAALVLGADSAHAEGWSIGSNFGFTVVQPKGGGDNLVAIGLPGSVGQVIPGFQPGMRVGFPFGAGANETYFDAGLSSLTASGETLTGYQVTANLQHNLSSTGSSSPYFTVGGGVLGQSYPSESFSNPILGGGLGLLGRVADGHGTLRAELRFDYVFEDQQGFEGGSVLGIKFGFDLWIK